MYQRRPPSSIEQLDKCADAGAQLLRVGIGVVGLQAQHRHTGLLQRTGDGVFLRVVQAAELQAAIDHAVHMVLLDHAQDIVNPPGVGGEAGAVGLHIPLAEGHKLPVQGGLGLVNQVLKVAGAGTHLLADHRRAAGLDDIVELPVGHGQGRACDQDALRPGRYHAHAVRNALLQLAGQLVAHLGAADRVVKEGDLHHQQRVPPGDGQAGGLAAVVDPGQGLALLVDDVDGLVQLLHGDGVAGEFLHLFRKFGNLILPLEDVLLPLHLGHVHDVQGHILTEDLIGFLLAVAGGLAHVHVRNAEEGAGPAQACAHAGLDEGAGALGQYGLAAGHPELAAAAQAGNDAVCRHDHLVRHIDTERAEDLAALLLLLDELLGPDAVDLRDHQIPEIHPLGPVLLGQEHIPHSGGQHLAQQVVVLQVHP